MLAGGVVGRVQNIAGVDGATPLPSAEVLNTAEGYVSDGGRSTSSSNSGFDGVVDSTLVASTAIGTGRRRRIPLEKANPRAAAPAALGARVTAGAPAPPARKFRADRVQGRSWSIEDGELVARGIGGDEIRGPDAAIDENAGFDRSRRGRGRRGRGRR